MRRTDFRYPGTEIDEVRGRFTGAPTQSRPWLEPVPEAGGGSGCLGAHLPAAGANRYVGGGSQNGLKKMDHAIAKLEFASRRGFRIYLEGRLGAGAWSCSTNPADWDFTAKHFHGRSCRWPITCFKR